MTPEQMDDVLSLMAVMFDNYPSQNGQSAENAIRGCLMAIEGCSYQAVKHVLRAVIIGDQRGFENKWAPTSGQLGQWCRKADEVLTALANRGKGDGLVRYAIGEQPPEGLVPLGPVKVNLGNGDIDMTEMTHAEKERLLSAPWRPPGSSAGLTFKQPTIEIGDPDAETGHWGDEARKTA